MSVRKLLDITLTCILLILFYSIIISVSHRLTLSFYPYIFILSILGTCSPLIVVVQWVKLFMWSYIWSKLITTTGPSLFTGKYLCLGPLFQDFQRVLPGFLKHCVLRRFVKHMSKLHHYCGHLCVNLRVKHLYFARLTHKKLNYNNVIVFSRNSVKNTDKVYIERFSFIHQQMHIIRYKSHTSLRKLLHVTAQRYQPVGVKNKRNLSRTHQTL